MAYNVTLADRHGTALTVELLPGGGARLVRPGIATNHQYGAEGADRPSFTKTHERRDHLEQMIEGGIAPRALEDAFLDAPLYQRNYAQGFGTLFTAVYDPNRCRLTLRWPGHDWPHDLEAFVEGRREISYAAVRVPASDAAVFGLDAMLEAICTSLPPEVAGALERWAEDTRRDGPDWRRFGAAFAQPHR
jgi:hypothetical protein